METPDEKLDTPGKVFAYWRTVPEMREFVRQCYYDEVADASQRFVRSEEFSCVLQLLYHHAPNLKQGRVLDLGGGNGVAAVAWEQCGYETFLLEPDTDSIVGYNALKDMKAAGRTTVHVVHAYGEAIPFPDESFDIVYVRQVLHHIVDLTSVMRAISRVLKSGGILIATREHVISRPQDIQKFFSTHALHKYTGGENAYLLSDYTKSMTATGLDLREVLGFYSSPVNYAPLTTAELKSRAVAKLAKITGPRIARRVIENRLVFQKLQRLMDERDQTPGRMYTFIAVKP